MEEETHTNLHHHTLDTAVLLILLLCYVAAVDCLRGSLGGEDPNHGTSDPQMGTEKETDAQKRTRRKDASFLMRLIISDTDLYERVTELSNVWKRKNGSLFHYV